MMAGWYHIEVLNYEMRDVSDYPDGISCYFTLPLSNGNCIWKIIETHMLKYGFSRAEKFSWNMHSLYLTTSIVFE